MGSGRAGQREAAALKRRATSAPPWPPADQVSAAQGALSYCDEAQTCNLSTSEKPVPVW